MKFINFKAVIFSIFMLCITYFAWFNPSIEEMNVPLFLTILALSYIIFSKFYLITKLVKEQNLSNVILVLVIFCLLFIPSLYMNQDFISEAEERRLENFPSLITNDNKPNYQFGKEFEKSFNDRFLGRNQLISFHNNLKILLSKDLTTFPLIHFYKSNGWMLSNKDFYGFKSYSDEQLKTLSNNINKLNNFCTKNNIKLYIMIVPSKENIYQDVDSIKRHHKLKKQNKAISAVNNIKKTNKNIDIYYPEKELLKLKNEGSLVFFKTDSHPTDDAAYELYKIFIGNMSKDFKNLSITPLSEFKKSQNNLVRATNNADFYEEGTYYRMAYINYPKLLSTQYNYYNYLHPEQISIEQNGLHQTYTNKNGNYKLFILGDSFQENISRFLSTNFYKIDKWRGNFKEIDPPRDSNLDMYAFEPIISDFKPNILFIILHQDNTDWFLDLYPNRRAK